ncbi:MAG: H-type lectin domain-containing protein [Melioribacteraceae bacterium]|nr:H-type lectin domain-containing protein [Melioribacteraceae bacterium]
MKKLSFLLTLITVIFLFSTVNAQTIQTGKYEANYQAKGYSLNEGSGRRVHTIEVRFEKPFETTPEVIVTVTYLNADTKDGVRVRYEVGAKAISRDGFIIELATWDDSKVHGIRGDWLAFSN